MYDDDDDQGASRRLSFLSFPQSETISVSPVSKSPTSPQSSIEEEDTTSETNGQQNRPPLIKSSSFDRDKDSTNSSSTTSSRSDLSPGQTATASFPLNNVDYESNPAAVVHELDNLAAIRRMSMDAGATGDPDFPSFDSESSVPSLPPSPSADENDASRLFWVPARLHPELAPTEFKSFLESKAEQIKRRSGDFSSLGQGQGGGIQRRSSTLSKQIDSPNDFTDGAERLQRKRSDSPRSSSPNLQDLETLVDGSKKLNNDAASFLQDFGASVEEDRPILLPAPPGIGLRRSTRTQYRKGGSRKGERVPFSRRHARTETSESSPLHPPPMVHVSSDPAENVNGTQAAYQSRGDTEHTLNDSIDSSPPKSPVDQVDTTGSGDEASVHTQDKPWHSRVGSNERPTVHSPEATQHKIPVTVETSLTDPSRAASIRPPSSHSSQQEQQQEPIPSFGNSPAFRDTSQDHHHHHHHHHESSRLHRSRQPSKESRSIFTGITSGPQIFSHNNSRTDSLSFIPTVIEEKRQESKRSKEKDGSRKSSWHRFLGGDEKDKKKEKENDLKKHKLKTADKSRDNARVELPPPSADDQPRGRETLVLERPEPNPEEERRKDGVKRSSGEPKKEKESGILSSIFGGGKKKSSSSSSDHHHHKKSASSRHQPPEPPARILQPDIDYAWSRFPILEERAIYRMAHIKLANPRRALYSQVLLSNFMYSYLAKVQQMHPTMMMAAAAAQRQQQQQQQQQQQAEQAEEYAKYQEVS